MSDAAPLMFCFCYARIDQWSENRILAYSQYSEQRKHNVRLFTSREAHFYMPRGALTQHCIGVLPYRETEEAGFMSAPPGYMSPCAGVRGLSNSASVCFKTNSKQLCSSTTLISWRRKYKHSREREYKAKSLLHIDKMSIELSCLCCRCTTEGCFNYFPG